MNNKILLFIPMYNCKKQIVRVLKQLNREICSYLTEIIVINNRSTDNGEIIVKDYIKQHTFPIKISLLRNDENYGLGGSHKVAFNYAMENGFDYIILLHGDDQVNIDNLLPYLKSKEYEKYDCFLGARFMKGSILQGYSTFRTFGNQVYNCLFAIGTNTRVYDLGSGLNMYRVKSLSSKYYLRYKDNLMFNYCMVIGQAYYKMNVKFFPIIWREDDQISNVKMINQAIVVLKLLFSYMKNKRKFIEGEHRDKIVESYTVRVIYSNEGGREEL